jgi:hypothetical protein
VSRTGFEPAPVHAKDPVKVRLRELSATIGVLAVTSEGGDANRIFTDLRAELLVSGDDAGTHLMGTLLRLGHGRILLQGGRSPV